MLQKYLESKHLPGRIFWAVIFAALFSSVSFAIPQTYYKFIDTTEYLTIDSPISVDGTYYKPCDLVSVGAGIESKIDVEAIVLTELVLVKDNGDTTRIDGSQIVQQAPFRKSEHRLISSYLKLPCELEDGRYYWQGNAVYMIRGFERTESYISETFNVTQSGLSPVGQDLQNQIDDLK
jgi:hypothetical protein